MFCLISEFLNNMDGPKGTRGCIDSYDKHTLTDRTHRYTSNVCVCVFQQKTLKL